MIPYQYALRRRLWAPNYGVVIASGKCGDNAYWTIYRSGLLLIDGTGDMYSYFNIEKPWSKKKDIFSLVKIKGISTIGAGAFESFDNIIEVSMSNSVIHIDAQAFNRCTWLQKIKLSKNLLTPSGQSYRVFGDCSHLINIEIPDGVTYIYHHYFEYCTRLATITIPASVTNIESGAFYECNRLRDVYYAGTQRQWERINIAADNDPLLNATKHYNYGVI